MAKQVKAFVINYLDDLALPKGWKPFAVVYHEKQWWVWCSK